MPYLLISVTRNVHRNSRDPDNVTIETQYTMSVICRTSFLTFSFVVKYRMIAPLGLDVTIEFTALLLTVALSTCSILTKGRKRCYHPCKMNLRAWFGKSFSTFKVVKPFEFQCDLLFNLHQPQWYKVVPSLNQDIQLTMWHKVCQYCGYEWEWDKEVRLNDVEHEKIRWFLIFVYAQYFTRVKY